MRKIVLCGAIAVVALLLIAGYWNSEARVGLKGADSIEHVEAQQLKTTENGKQVDDLTLGETDLGPVQDPVASEQPSLASYASKRDETDEKLLAQWKIEIAKWRIDAGYPADADFSAYAGIPVDELASLASNQDKAAAYLAGLELAAAGREDEARNILFDSASDGSIAAARLLQEMYLGYYGVPKDVAEAEAWGRVAQTMGGGVNPAGPLTADEATVANHLFSLYWQEINTRFMQEHGFQLPIRPIPLLPASPDPGG